MHHRLGWQSFAAIMALYALNGCSAHAPGTSSSGAGAPNSSEAGSADLNQAGSESNGGAGAAGDNAVVGGMSGSADGPDAEPDSLPKPEASITGTRDTWGEYSFIVPRGLTGTAEVRGYSMLDASTAPGSVCGIFLGELMPAEEDRVAQAYGLLSQFSVSLDLSPTLPSELGDGSASEFYLRGFASSGWDYVQLRSRLKAPNQESAGLYAQIMLVNLGKQVAPIYGVESFDDTCLEVGLGRSSVTWATLFYSLEFPSYTGLASADQLNARVLGKWQDKGLTIADNLVVAANGRYANAVTISEYSNLSASEVLLTTTTFEGDGRFVVSGDQFARFPDHARAVNVRYRIEEWGPLSEGRWSPTFYWLLQGEHGLFESAYEGVLE